MVTGPPCNPHQLLSPRRRCVNRWCSVLCRPLTRAASKFHGTFRGRNSFPVSLHGSRTMRAIGSVTMPEYVIRCTTGGLLRDDASGKVIRFATRAEAAAEAVRLTQEADSNSRVAGVDFTAVPILESGDGFNLID